MESQTSIYSNRKYSFQILDNLSIDLEITDNPFSFQLEELFVMAARRNKKRSFLFVSKILGKHLPINAAKGLLTGSLLAEQYAHTLTGMEFGKDLKLAERFRTENPAVPESFIPEEISPVIIGFAETATALGQAFFASFKRADFFHTTRELIVGADPLITFEEEHSHATSHRCYISRELLDNRREIVLVDDEMSTGKTAVNIIRSIQSEFPRDVYSVVSILDWRSDGDVQRFQELEKELGIKINCVSLLRGNFTVSGHSPETELISKAPISEMQEPIVQKIALPKGINSVYFGGKLEGIPYAAFSGRFGVNEREQYAMDQNIMDYAAFLLEKRSGGKTLCVGTGEFMYIPMKIAALMGDDVSYQSTTRSPIHIVDMDGYGARYGMAFPSPENPEIDHFLYNVAPYKYDEVFIFFEREVPDEWLEPMLKEFKRSGIPSVKIVFLQGLDGED
jgi:hypothetical protein